MHPGDLHMEVVEVRCNIKETLPMPDELSNLHARACRWHTDTSRVRHRGMLMDAHSL